METSDFKRVKVNPEGSVCYLCGPYGASRLFDSIEKALKDIGAHVINPNTPMMRGTPKEGEVFAANMMRLCREADIVVLIPGWEYDGKALAERQVAREIGMMVCEYDEIGGD